MTLKMCKPNPRLTVDWNSEASVDERQDAMILLAELKDAYGMDFAELRDVCLSAIDSLEENEDERAYERSMSAFNGGDSGGANDVYAALEAQKLKR